MISRRTLAVASPLVALLLAAAPAAAQPPTAPPGRLVRVPGAEIHLREHGRGEPLLLLHGFLDCGGAWDPFIERLAERHRVIVMELRGHGRSTNPSRTFTMRQSADDVLAVLDTLGLRRVRAMGISAGGMSLLHVATRQPERLQSLVLIGATTRFVDQTREFIRTGGTREAIPPPVLEFFRQCTSRGDAQLDELLAQFRALGAMRDDPNFTAADLARITAPTLVVHGDRDEFFPVEIAVEMYRGIPTAELWVVPRGDHVPVYDPLVPFADRALRFLARPAAGSVPPSDTAAVRTAAQTIVSAFAAEATRAHAASLGAPPTVQVRNTPQLISFAATANEVVVPLWETQPNAMRTVFRTFAGGADADAERLFRAFFNRFLVAHEAAHWFQARAGRRAATLYENEEMANRLAVAFWRTQPGGEDFLAELERLATQAAATLPDPTPPGEDAVAYFGAHYRELGADPLKYGYYQFRFMRDALRERARLDFARMVADDAR